MPIVHVEGIPGIKNGEYELDMSWFTHGEQHRIKRLSEVLPLDYVNALSKGDTDLALAFGAIALERAGYQIPDEVLWNLRIGAISLDFTKDIEAAEKEEEKLPPDSGPVAPVSDDEKSDSAGPSTRNGGDSHPVSDLSATGSLR